MPSWRKLLQSGSDADLRSISASNGAIIYDALYVSGSTTITGSINVSGSITVPGGVVNELTASYAINAQSTAVNSGWSYHHAVSDVTWSLQHNLATKYPLVEIWSDIDDSVVIPDRITSIDLNNIEVTFTQPVSGWVNISRAGHILSGSLLWSSLITSSNASNRESLTINMDVTGSISASNGFSGSFYGDGSNLTGITAEWDGTHNGNAEITGSLIVSGALTASSLQVANIDYPTTDATYEYQFLQSDASGSLTFADVTTLYDTIVNGESFQLEKGTPVYVSGAQGANPIVYQADAYDPSKMPVIYIISEAIAAGGVGRGITLGTIDGIDLTGIPVGTDVYVGASGSWVITKPTGSAIIQPLGLVKKTGTGGKGLVLNPGPATLPNINQSNIWIGASTHYPTEISYSLDTLTSYGNTTTNSISVGAVTASSFTGSFVGDGSQLTGITGGVFPYTGSAEITGSLTVNGNTISNYITASNGFKISSGTLTIGSQNIYPQGSDGFSVNENFNVGNSTQTAYHFTSGNPARTSVVFSLARTNNFTNMFGVTGSSTDNKFVIGSEFGGTDFEWRKNLGVTPVDLQGGTLLASLDRSGSLYVSKNITAISFTGSLSGSATNAITSSYALTASYVDSFETLDTVTANGNTTTNNITVGEITASIFKGKLDGEVIAPLKISGSAFTTEINTHKATTTTTTETVATVDVTDDVDGIFFDYIIRNGGGTSKRVGTVYAVNANPPEYSDISTLDIGDTSDVAFNVVYNSGNILLQSISSTTGWQIKSLTRTL